MALGLGVLKLAPAQFWSMTPRELAAAAAGAFGPVIAPAAPARCELDRLMQRFPDQPRPAD